jgi:hypothetical protein
MPYTLLGSCHMDFKHRCPLILKNFLFATALCETRWSGLGVILNLIVPLSCRCT